MIPQAFICFNREKLNLQNIVIHILYGESVYKKEESGSRLKDERKMRNEQCREKKDKVNEIIRRR